MPNLAPSFKRPPVASGPSGEDGQSDRLASWLCKRAAYPHATTRVDTIETHISWLFLTDRFVYKLKKPVRFEFLDFSTPDLRHAACLEEVRLNRRLAPDVYLGVTPVSQDRTGRFRLGSSTAPVDWLVKMRRLPADRALDQLIMNGATQPAELAELAARLGDFFCQLPPLTVKTEDYRRDIEAHVRANEHDLQGLLSNALAHQVRRVHAAQIRFLRLAGNLLDDRVRNGRIVDGHGDLRPEHIYLCPRPTVIDGIEFSPELRRLDVLDELAFLAMECERLGNSTVGRSVIEHYCGVCGDTPPAVLLAFYQCYRACVRAKVNALRASQTPHENRNPSLRSVEGYLDLADHYASQLGPPLLIVVRGLSGTGKSTLARTLAEQLALDLFQTDAIRDEVFPETDGESGYLQGRYQPEKRARVYEELMQSARQQLQRGCSVVLDGTFLSAATRLKALSLAEQCGARTVFVRCDCPPATARLRIAERTADATSPSEARTDWLDLQREAEEPDPSHLSTVHLDTTSPLPTLLESVDDAVRAQGWAPLSPELG